MRGEKYVCTKEVLHMESGYSKARPAQNEPNPAPARRTLLQLPVGAIYPNPYQPRRTFDEEKERELMRSIAESGLIQPLVVRAQNGRYELIAGERRLRACKALGIRTVACVVLSCVGEADSAMMALIENVQRESLPFFEEAECYRALLTNYHLTQEALARRLGKSQSFLANKLRILQLAPAMRRRMAEAGLTERHARALLRLTNERQQEDALERIVHSALNVRDTERLIERMLQKQAERPKPTMVRLLRDYRLFVNSVKLGAAQLRETGLCVELVQTDAEDGDGVDMLLRIRRMADAR